MKPILSGQYNDLLHTALYNAKIDEWHNLKGFTPRHCKFWQFLRLK